MKKLLYSLTLLLALATPTLAQSYSLRMKEVDGTPNQPGVRTIIVPNGSLSCSGPTCTLIFSGGGSGTVNSGTAGQLTYYAGTGTTVSGSSVITTGGGFTLNLVQPTNGDHDGLAIYANNLSQHTEYGWKGIVSTSAGFYLNEGNTTLTLGDPVQFLGSGGTIMSLDMHDGGNGSVGIGYTIAAGTDGQLYVVSGAATRPGLVVKGASSQSADIVSVYTSTPTLVFHVTSTGAPSGPATDGAPGERFGAGSVALNSGTVFGNGSTASGTSSVVMGASATSTGAQSVVMGTFATAAAGQRDVILGYGASAGGFNDVIALGQSAIGRAANQMVVGSDNSPINDVYFGNGVLYSLNMANFTLHATGGFSSDDVGTHLNLAGGQSTGNATPGRVHVQTGAIQASSGTAQTLIDREVFGASKVLADNTITTLVNVTDASDTSASGIVDYAVEVIDASHNIQVETGSFVYQVTNSNGTIANNTITFPASYPVNTATSGTLTVTWVITAANPALLRITADTSLTPATGYPRVTYSLRNLTSQAVAVQ